METPSHTQLKNARIFISQYLKDACQEIKDWHNTGLLPQDGIIAQVAQTLSDPVFSENKLGLVEREVNAQAIDYVIEFALD